MIRRPDQGPADTDASDVVWRFMEVGAIDGLYHLDGQEQFRHLDALLEIAELDAIEWTPNAKLPLGGDPQWFDLYRRILDAGKSVQVYMVWPQEIVPVLDAIGGEGVYVLGLFQSMAQVETVARARSSPIAEEAIACVMKATSIDPRVKRAR